MKIGKGEDLIKEAAEALKNGEIAAIPTETVYGLAANALSETAVEKIFQAKGRPQNNPLIVHISEIEQMELYARPDSRAFLLAEKFWPGPLTMIMPKRDIIPDKVTAGLDSVAIRMPSDTIARKIISLAGVPLAAPSANLSGKPSPTKAEHVRNDYLDKTDKNRTPLLRWIIDGGECTCGVESTVVSLLDQTPVLLRPGFITLQQLQQYLPDIHIAPGVVEKINTDKPLSPGLVHRHYAADADTEGVDGESLFSAIYINREKNRYHKPAVMCFDEEKMLFDSSLRTVSYGSFQKPEILAKNLFDKLRELDQEKHDKIFIRIPSPDGVGLAVYNRLLRSCEFHITHCFPFEIGLTGQSGAGKGTLAKALKNYGFFHIDGDLLVEAAYEDVAETLTEQFGSVILENGKIVREKLSEIAFSSREKTKLLNTTVHGAIMNRALKIAAEKAKKQIPCLFDGAALFEAKAEKYCRTVVAVAAPKEIRLERIRKRDNLTEEKIFRRFACQKEESFYSQKADITVINDGKTELHELCKKILKYREEQKNGSSL